MCWRSIWKIPKNVDLVLCAGDLGKADLARKRFFENLARTKKGLKEIPNDKKHMRAILNGLKVGFLEHFLEKPMGKKGKNKVKKELEKAKKVLEKI